MKRYIYTNPTPGHILLPELDSDGKAVMIIPDAAAVKAAMDANLNNERAERRGAPAGAKIRVAPVVKVPVPMPKIKEEVRLKRNGEYELPEDNEDVKQYVLLGYLKEIPAKPVVAVVPSNDRAPGHSEGAE